MNFFFGPLPLDILLLQILSLLVMSVRTVQEKDFMSHGFKAEASSKSRK